MIFALSALLGCGATPEVMMQEPPPPPIERAAPAPVGERVRDPSLDLGAFKAWREADGSRSYEGPEGELRFDRDDWGDFLRAGTPEQVAERVAYALNAGQTVVLTPGDPPNDRIPGAEWALVEAPKVQILAGGAVRLEAWIGQPPGFAPTLLTMRAPPGEATTLTLQPASELISPEQRLAQQLAGLDSDSSWTVKASAEALGEAKVAEAVPGLVRALGHDWADARKAAAKALGAIGGAEAVAGLEAAALGEADRAVALDELRALDSIGTPEARAALARVAEAHPDSVVQARAGALAKK